MRSKLSMLVVLLMLIISAPPEAPAYTFTDDFSGNSIDASYWTIGQSGGNTVTLDSVNHYVLMTQNGSSGSSSLSFDKFSISGNFDVRLDYKILNRAGSANTNERIGLGAGSVGTVQRVADPWNWIGNGYISDFQGMLGNGAVLPYYGKPSTDTKGTLRIVRDSVTGISTYYLDADGMTWDLVYSVPLSTAGYYNGSISSFGPAVWNSYTDQTGMQIAFDNFYLDAPGWTGPPGTGGGPSTVPEPATLLLLGAGLIGLAGYGRKKLS